MVVADERSSLHVEGTDDFHSVIHLLMRNGIDYDSKPSAMVVSEGRIHWQRKSDSRRNGNSDFCQFRPGDWIRSRCR